MLLSNIRSLFSNVRYLTYRSDVFPKVTNFQWFDEKVYLVPANRWKWQVIKFVTPGRQGHSENYSQFFSRRSYVSILLMGESCHIICHVVSMSNDVIRLLKKNHRKSSSKIQSCSTALWAGIAWRFNMLEFLLEFSTMMIFKLNIMYSLIQISPMCQMNKDMTP